MKNRFKKNSFAKNSFAMNGFTKNGFTKNGFKKNIVFCLVICLLFTQVAGLGGLMSYSAAGGSEATIADLTAAIDAEIGTDRGNPQYALIEEAYTAASWAAYAAAIDEAINVESKGSAAAPAEIDAAFSNLLDAKSALYQRTFYMEELPTGDWIMAEDFENFEKSGSNVVAGGFNTFNWADGVYNPAAGEGLGGTIGMRVGPQANGWMSKDNLGDRYENLYVRFYARTDAGWNGGSIGKLIELSGDVPAWTGIFTTEDGDFALGTSAAAVDGFTYDAPSPIKPFSAENAGQWFCVEIYFKAGAMGSVDIYVDDILQHSKNNVAFPMGDFNAVKFNNTSFPAGGIMYLDNIVASKSKIGLLNIGYIIEPQGVDKTGLIAALDAAIGQDYANPVFSLNIADYTEVSWNNYAAVIGEAVALVGDVYATQMQVDDAVALIETTKSHLIVFIDGKDALEAAIIAEIGADFDNWDYLKIDPKNPMNYSENSWNIYEAAISAAIAIYGDPAMTSQQAQDAINGMASARQALKRVGVKPVEKPESQWLFWDDFETNRFSGFPPFTGGSYYLWDGYPNLFNYVAGAGLYGTRGLQFYSGSAESGPAVGFGKATQTIEAWLPQMPDGERINDAYVRFYLKVDEGWTGDVGTFFKIGTRTTNWWAGDCFLEMYSINGGYIRIEPTTNWTASSDEIGGWRNPGGIISTSAPYLTAANAGKWMCFELRWKLNSDDAPGTEDGQVQLWIDGILAGSSSGANYVGPSSAGINFVQLVKPALTNKSMAYDNLVISKGAIGPVDVERGDETYRDNLEALLDDEIGTDYENPVYIRNEADYLARTWAAYKAAIENGIKIQKDLNASQQVIDAAVAAITDAIARLAGSDQADKYELELALDAEIGRDRAQPHYTLFQFDYTANSWAAYAAAIEAGIIVEADVAAAEQDVSDAVAAIKAAKSALADITVLNAIITSHVGDNHSDPQFKRDKALYTQESWENFTASVLAAIELSKDPGATKQDILDALTAISETRNMLERKWSDARVIEHPTADWLWWDDFDDNTYGSYFEDWREGSKTFFNDPSVGLGQTTGMNAFYEPGREDAGSLKVGFGRTESSYEQPVGAIGEDLTELWTRYYVKLDAAWEGGGGAKLSRVTSLDKGWAQSFISHAWSMGGSGGLHDPYLGLDPASGIDINNTGKILLTNQYNDFNNLSWLGARMGTTPLYDSNHVGEWYCIETYTKFNEPGKKNGEFGLWIDGNQEVFRNDLDWIGSYEMGEGKGYGINTFFLENFWNDGNSPKLQNRYFDNLVLSRKRVGPADFLFGEEDTRILAINDLPGATIDHTQRTIEATVHPSQNRVDLEAVVGANVEKVSYWTDASCSTIISNPSSYTLPSSGNRTVYAKVISYDGMKSVYKINIAIDANAPQRINWLNLTANGVSGVETTTELELVFDRDITLTIDDISVIGAEKESLSGAGQNYILAISNIAIANGENITVAIDNQPLLTPGSRFVAVYKQKAPVIAKSALAAIVSPGTLAIAVTEILADGTADMIYDTFTIQAGGAYQVGAYHVVVVISGANVIDCYFVDEEPPLPAVPYVTLSGPASVVSGPGAIAGYTIAARNMPDVTGIELVFEVDGNYLASREFTAMGGLTLLAAGSYGTPVYWTNDGNIWRGKATLLDLGAGGAGGAGGASGASGDFDIMEMVYNVAEGALGTAEVKLVSVKLSSSGATVEADIVDGSVFTTFEKSYSRFDLNKDGVIDLNDLTFALQFLNMKAGDPGWEAAKVADLAEDGKIDIEDLIMILANYTVPYYE